MMPSYYSSGCLTHMSCGFYGHQFLYVMYRTRYAGHVRVASNGLIPDVHHGHSSVPDLTANHDLLI